MAQTRWLHAGAAKVRVGVRDKHVVVKSGFPRKSAITCLGASSNPGRRPKRSHGKNRSPPPPIRRRPRARISPPPCPIGANLLSTVGPTVKAGRARQRQTKAAFIPRTRAPATRHQAPRAVPASSMRGTPHAQLLDNLFSGRTPRARSREAPEAGRASPPRHQ